jgi:hypothetical protein
MTHAEKIGEFLKAHVGLYFCSFCLGRELAIDSFIARNVVWELQTSPGYRMQTTKCVACSRAKRVIAAVGGFAVLGPEAHVVAFLLDNRGLAFCNACLAFANEISFAEAQRVADYLQPLPEFERLTSGQCSVCVRASKPVISALASAGDDRGDRLLNGAASIGESTVHYRGWRIDVLSYRVVEGWRPFIVIHGSERAMVPDAASWWDPVPTKAEADAYALAKARDWIDKRF